MCSLGHMSSFLQKALCRVADQEIQCPGLADCSGVVETEVRTSELTPAGPEIQGCSESLGVRIQLKKALFG